MTGTLVGSKESCKLLLLPLFSVCQPKIMQRNTESVKGTITPPSGMFRVLPESPLRVITTTNVLTITSF